MKNKTRPLTAVLPALMAASGLKRQEIAERLQYENANIITMFKQGMTKVPLNKIPPLARALGVDPKYLMNLALREYMPELVDVMEEIYGRIITDDEYAALEFLREVFGDRPVALDEDQKAEIRRVLLKR